MRWKQAADGRRRIRAVEADRVPLDPWADRSEAGLAQYLQDLHEAGWELLCAFVPDEDVEMYFFERAREGEAGRSADPREA